MDAGTSFPKAADVPDIAHNGGDVVPMDEDDNGGETPHRSQAAKHPVVQLPTAECNAPPKWCQCTTTVEAVVKPSGDPVQDPSMSSHPGTSAVGETVQPPGNPVCNCTSVPAICGIAN